MTTLEWMQIIWAAILAISVIMYTVLDGFDLGVGGSLLTVKKDEERRILLNSIGPFWDGNEVWLIIIAGGLFAGFPAAYALVFSALYVPTMVLLGGIIFRAVAIEFRSKRESRLWRETWDHLFAAGSLLIAFVAGVFIANLILGLPINAKGEVETGSIAFFTPYTTLVGFLGMALFTCHGNLFLMFKTEGALKERLAYLFKYKAAFFILLYLVVTALTLYVHPRIAIRFVEMPLLTVVPLLGVISIFLMWFFQRRKCYGRAFIASSLTIVFLFVNYAIGAYPYLLYSTIDPSYSLTIFNSSVTETTFKVLLVIAAIGVPLVLAYGAILYTVFHGKTKITHSSY